MKEAQSSGQQGPVVSQCDQCGTASGPGHLLLSGCCHQHSEAEGT